MTETKTRALAFQPFSEADRALYETYLRASPARGCEYSFANRVMWGEQSVAYYEGLMIVLSRFGERYVYSYPIGEGDKRAALEAVLADARTRGISYRFSGLLPEEAEELERLYPNRFAFTQNEGSFDYVYEIDALADLAGKKYHAKRNHCARFEREHPELRLEQIDRTNVDRAREMSRAWYEERRREDPEGGYEMEMRAIACAYDRFETLGLEGLLLLDGDEVMGLTMGSRMTEDTFDVNFEKAWADVGGAYAYINRAFARHLREKYPALRYLNREEDMGIEGLRRAKESYYPHHRVVKYRATPVEV